MLRWAKVVLRRCELGRGLLRLRRDPARRMVRRRGTGLRWPTSGVAWAVARGRRTARSGVGVDGRRVGFEPEMVSWSHEAAEELRLAAPEVSRIAGEAAQSDRGGERCCGGDRSAAGVARCSSSDAHCA
jgi:hypothetical protein